MNHLFASDNCSGVHPVIMSSITSANIGHDLPYGEDSFTLELNCWAGKTFGNQSLIYPVLTGTGANVLSISSCTRPFNSIICADTAHLNIDECGSPERFAGTKTIAIQNRNGKVIPENLLPALSGFGFQHHSQPALLTISEATEFGTLYSPDEIRILADIVHDRGMLLHMDGARIANAAAALNTGLRELTTDAGVDILSLGGTKNGLMYGECVVFTNPEPAMNFPYIRKQAMQLASKTRYISAQLLALYDSDLWLKNAESANRAAIELKSRLEKLPWVTLTKPVQTNMVFAVIPAEIRERLLEKRFFYVWDETTGEVRWMTSWDTNSENIDEFVRDLVKASKCQKN
ncbi:MAG: threonine aldolase [Candidatus Wallbacteria bacterium HGW-Wallbacteria-1]|uniref:Threonine aldolase n=1 Tax=Candidatus Wallbacteria bacterium HGW-Wallbacteria-1 TaxID=2013854 RepID=A0A2N1PS01_9BACT|nr:MAG: threonine aldolase [Candidatus Wallbacteria bacterium HGW-Wallbacteria-1]